MICSTHITHMSNDFALNIYIYIYIYIERERERDYQYKQIIFLSEKIFESM
jgi:hypothetical protein